MLVHVDMLLLSKQNLLQGHDKQHISDLESLLCATLQVSITVVHVCVV